MVRKIGTTVSYFFIFTNLKLNPFIYILIVRLLGGILDWWHHSKLTSWKILYAVNGDHQYNFPVLNKIRPVSYTHLQLVIHLKNVRSETENEKGVHLHRMYLRRWLRICKPKFVLYVMKLIAVSYTHLDVYKRQALEGPVVPLRYVVYLKRL